ncbi:hypothetical protein Tco_1101746 [Tanacetum coccineum]
MVKISFDLNEPKDNSKTDKAAENGRTLSHSHWKSTMAGALHRYLAGLTLVDRLGLDYGMHHLQVDADVLEVAKYVKDYKIIMVYVEHGSSIFPTSSVEASIVLECDDDPFEDLDEILGDYANTGKKINGDEITRKQLVIHVVQKVDVGGDNESEEESDIEGDYTSGSDSEDSNYDPKHDEVFDDDEHIVEDVHVSMNNFSFTVDPKHDFSIGVIEVHEDDLDVIDYDSFGSDLDDEINSERRIQLRELRRIGKQKNKGPNKYYFYLGQQFASKERVTGRGLIQAIASVFPSAEHRYCVRHIHENMKSQFKGGVYNKMLWNASKATFVGEFNKKMVELKSFNSDAYDWLMKIPAEQWSRAHFSVKPNVHAAYRLKTWAHVYSFKVNPCNGREMWPVVEYRTVIIPPLYKPQVGMPPKKRKKSHGDIANESCLTGKHSRKGKSVRCGKCGNVGHNRKGCKGQGGGSSQVSARKVSGQAAGATNISGQAAGARKVSGQAVGATNVSVSGQAGGASNVSSQSGGSSQPIAAQSTSTGARNGSSQPSAAPSTISQGLTQHSTGPKQGF